MRICIPILEDRGLLSPVCPHFGGSPAFLLVDSATLAYRSVPNPHSANGPRCDVPRALAGEHAIDAYIVGGIGANAFAEISRAKVPVYRSGRGRVADALAALIAGRLPVLREATDGPGWAIG